MKILVENKHGTGVIKLNPIHRWIHRKLFRKNLAKATIPFNWQQGFDVRNTIGQITIKNQGQSDSCGGQAGSYFIEIQRRLQKINEGAISAKSVYSPIFYPGGGTTVSALETQIAVRGGELEASVPSYMPQGEPLDELEYESISWESSATDNDALTRAKYTPIDIPLDMDSIANAIQQYGAVIFEIQGQNGNGWLSPNPTPPSSTNPNPYWQHFMIFIGATIQNGLPTLIALNSWGLEAGNQGVYYFQQNYFNAHGIIDVFTFAKDTTLSPVAGNNSVWAWLVNYFNSFGKSLSSP